MRRLTALSFALGLAVAGRVAPAAQGGAPAPEPAPSATVLPSPSPTPAGETPAEGLSAAEPTPTPAPDCLARPLDASERDTLLRLAWRTLSGHLTEQPIKDADLEAYVFTPCLMAPRGLFVTLKKGDQVRGRQGEIEPTRPLYQQVIVFTRRAATRDPRFLPLTERDLGTLVVNLSVIGERRTVEKPADIHLDTDGIFLEKWGRRALFLPGIATSQKWSAEKTLDELCSQATLPNGCWSESARIEVFRTEELTGGLPVEPPPAPSPTPEPSATPAGTARALPLRDPAAIPPGVASAASRWPGARSTI